MAPKQIGVPCLGFPLRNYRPHLPQRILAAPSGGKPQQCAAKPFSKIGSITIRSDCAPILAAALAIAG
jgi:hypothetical protein